VPELDLNSVVSDKQRWNLTADSPTPLYHRLYLLLRSYILDGTLTEGMQLPTEQDLAREFDVSRITTKRALDELANDKLVARLRGKGTYVTHRLKPEPLHAPMVGLLQEIESLGSETRATVLDAGVLQPPQEVRLKLGLQAGQTALYLARVRHQNGARFGFYRSWTRGMQLPDDLSLFEGTPRMTYFRNQGLRCRYMRQVISAEAASESSSEALGVAIGSPLLCLTRCIYPDRGNDSDAVDYLKVLYHPGRFEYHINLDLEGSQ